MALFMQPPGNYMVSSTLDDLLRAASPTPELLDREQKDLGEAEPDDKDLVACLKQSWDHECTANFDRWDKISRAWEMVNNNWASSADPDLSDIRLPEGLMLDKQVLGILFSMFEQSPNWWEPVTNTPSKEVFIHLVRDLVNDSLNNPRCNWWDIVEEGIESGVVTGHVTTLVAVKYGDTLQLGQGDVKKMEEDSTSTTGLFDLFQDAPAGSDKPFVPNNMIPVLHFRNIPSEFCNKDTSGENLYHMWALDLPVGLVFMQADKLGYDKAALLRAKDKSAISNSTNLVTMSRTNRAKALDGSSKLMRLTFHEGDLIDRATGAQLYTKKYTVMANECEIVYGPSEIPWWDCEPTIVDAPFLSMAHEVYGRGLISENVDTLMMTHVLNNQMLDYLNEAFCGAYEVDRDRLCTEAQRTNLKIHPRSVIPVEGSEGQPAIRRVQGMGEVANSAWQVAQALDQRKQNATATATAGGAPKGRGRITKGEFDARSAEGGAFWKLVFRNLQNKWLAKLLRLGFLRLLQSYPQPLWHAYVTGKKEQLLSADPSLSPEQAAAWGKAYDECANWDNEARYRQLGSSFIFNVKVFSSLMERQGQVEKGAFLVRNLAAVPGALQQINMQEWIRQMVVALGYDAEKIMNKGGMQPPNTHVKDGAPLPFGEEDDEAPDLTGGLMGGLPSMSPGKIQGGVVPGGPVSDTPGQPGPQPM